MLQTKFNCPFAARKRIPHRAKNLIKFATKNLTHTKFHDGPQRQSSIVITEKSQVQALINMLMKMQE